MLIKQHCKQLEFGRVRTYRQFSVNGLLQILLMMERAMK